MALAEEVEQHVEHLATEDRFISSVCRRAEMTVQGSALQELASLRTCRQAATERAKKLLEDFAEDLSEAAVAGHGAGAACSRVLEGCTAERARLLLGRKYREDGRGIDGILPGMGDVWTVHGTGDSVDWFNRITKERQEAPPEDWYKDEGTGGEWVYWPDRGDGDGEALGQSEEAAGGAAASRKDEV